MARARPQPAGQRVLVLGAAGGVASATLALLTSHRLGRALLEPVSEILLLDRVGEPAACSAGLAKLAADPRARWLPATEVDSRAVLEDLVRRHGVDEVIELADVGTWDCVEACASGGASFVTTTYDTWPDAEPEGSEAARTMVRARDMFAPPEVDAGVHVIGMGMNPGLINLLVEAGLRELAARSGRPPSLAALDLHALLFTEVDATQSDAPLPPPADCFPGTWSPEGCLYELLEPSAMAMLAGEAAKLDHRPAAAHYRARCGAEEIAGFVVPHEEIVTLSAMYPGLDLAYIYRLAPASRASLAAAPDRAWDAWATHRLYPPHSSQLRGFNRLGVLLCSRSLGELWIGWQTPMAAGLAHGTNATLLQVGAGVIVGWTLARELDEGVWLPEELDSRRALALAAEMLGPPEVIWDRDAPPRSLAERRTG